MVFFEAQYGHRDPQRREGRGLVGDSPQQGETKPQESRPRPHVTVVTFVEGV